MSSRRVGRCWRRFFCAKKIGSQIIKNYICAVRDYNGVFFEILKRNSMKQYLHAYQREFEFNDDFREYINNPDNPLAAPFATWVSLDAFF